MTTKPAHPNAPDASADCPRCNYFRQHEKELDNRRMGPGDWPLGIDQAKAQDLLNRAFPQKQRDYSR